MDRVVVEKVDPAAGKADLVGVVRRVDLAAVEKARGMAAAGRVGQVNHRGAVGVTGLLSSRRFLQFAPYHSLRIKFAAFSS